MVQLSHPYMTTGKTIALTRWIFLNKVMSLLFNMLSRFQIFNTLIFYLPYTFSQEVTGRQVLPVKVSKPRKRKALNIGNRKETEIIS